MVPKSWFKRPVAVVALASPVVVASTAKIASSPEGLWQGKLLVPGGACGLTMSIITLVGGLFDGVRYAYAKAQLDACRPPASAQDRLSAAKQPYPLDLGSMLLRGT